MFTKLLGRPSKSVFAQAIMDAVRKNGNGPELIYDETDFKLSVGSSDSKNHFNLGNVYEEYLSAGPFARRTLISRYARLISGSGVDSIPKTFREAQSSLLPRIRERSYQGITRLYCEVEGLELSEMAHRVLADHLVVELAYDLPESIVTISTERLGEWGVGIDLALDVAFRNLLDGSRPRFSSPCPGVYVSAWRDNYDASRLVLMDMIRDLEVKGDHVAMVPHRDILIVTGTEDERGLRKMADITESAMGEARFMTAIPVRLQWDAWVPCRLPDGHPVRERFEILRAQTLMREYEEQKAWLDKKHVQDGDDVFIASYSATQDQDTASVTSFCVWSKDVVTLLPQTDVVYFYDDDQPKDEGIVAAATWDAVQEIVGGLMRSQESCPARYLVEDFPSAAQLAELRQLPLSSGIAG